MYVYRRCEAGPRVVETAQLKQKNLFKGKRCLCVHVYMCTFIYAYTCTYYVYMYVLCIHVYIIFTDVSICIRCEA